MANPRKPVKTSPVSLVPPPAPPSVPVAPAPAPAAPMASPPPEVEQVTAALAGPVGDMQEMLRQAASSGLERSKLVYERIKASAEDATGTLEIAFKAAADGSTQISGKAIEQMRDNANAVFDLAQAMAGVKSFSDILVLQTEFARQRFEACSAQAKEMTGLIQKVSADTSAPLGAVAARTLGQAA